MFCHYQLWAAIGLVLEMFERLLWKASDPVSPAYDGVLAHLQQRQSLADCQVPDIGVGIHDQVRRKNPSKANATVAVDFVAKKSVKGPPSNKPGQKQC